MRKHDRNCHVHAFGGPDRLLMQPSEVPTVRQARKALSEIGEVVYAVRVDGGFVKIGHTTDIAARVAALRGELMAVAFGTYADEQAIHGRLAGHLHHGREWYWPTPGVMTVVNELRASMGMGPIAA